MTAPNRSTLWGRILADELASGGVEAVSLAPGSRSTPLTVAFAEHPDVTVYTHIDERSAAFFALGRGRRLGEPTVVVTTSGTATANLHPAIIEAHQGRVPMIVLTADRPPELRDSGANQTIDQRDLYGDATRWYAELPEPTTRPRTLRMLRTTAARALASAVGTPAGPVHLNCPFSKPLEPTDVPGDVPETLAEENELATIGRDGPFVRIGRETVTADDADVRRVASAFREAARPLIVAGPADPPGLSGEAIAALAASTGAPVLADPLSSIRFGPHVDDAPILGGYDAFLDGTWPGPDVVLRVGAAPTSRALREYLRDAECLQFLLDPAGSWRESTFTATDLVVADPDPFVRTVRGAMEMAENHNRTAVAQWQSRFLEVEHSYWRRVESVRERAVEFEGDVLATVLEAAPDPSTVFLSNSMPIRDADRFGKPRSARLTVLGNRGASGIDGITSTALGAGSATTEPLVLVTGDLAFFHDVTGLLATRHRWSGTDVGGDGTDRGGDGGKKLDDGTDESTVPVTTVEELDATLVVINNDGGGIFHMLPIESFDPPFTKQFKTPHDLNFEAVCDFFDLEYANVPPDRFEAVYRSSLSTPGTQVLEVPFDARESHRVRDEIATEF